MSVHWAHDQHIYEPVEGIIIIIKKIPEDELCLQDSEIL